MAILDSVQFEVFDTGIGISRENQGNLFKLFGKVLQKNKSVNKEGIGLGLFITKNLVSELSGLMTLDSIEGQFTKFTITLPVSRQLLFSKEHLDWLEERNIKLGDAIQRTQEISDIETTGDNVVLLVD